MIIRKCEQYIQKSHREKETNQEIEECQESYGDEDRIMSNEDRIKIAAKDQVSDREPQILP